MNKGIFFSLIVLIFFPCYGYSQRVNDFSAYKTENDIIYDICFTDKGDALGIADNNTIKVYSTNSKELITEFKNGHKNQIMTIDISKDSTLLVSGGKDSTIVIWDFVNNKILKSLTFQKGIITSVQISPNSKYLVSGGTDKKVYLYDIEKDNVIQVFTEYKDYITSVAFSPDGKLIVTASADRSINFYNVENTKLIKSVEGHRSWVRDISFSKDGTKLISCGDDSRIIIWNLIDKNRIREQTDYRAGFCWLLCIDFNEDSKTYASGDIYGKARIFGQFGEYSKKLGVPINKVLFIPNENPFLKIAIATRGKGVILLDARNMKFKND